MANPAIKPQPQNNARDLLRLARSENVGPITFHQLLAYYGNAAAALEALPELARRGGRKRPLIACSIEKTEAEMEKASQFGATLIPFGHADYPEALAYLPDAPPVLTLMGTPLWKSQRTLAMVGARNASANACVFAQMLARDLGKQQFCIASGLARGIDTATHKASLTTGTIAVIAGGIDHIYPPENESLYRQIAEQGAIISEQPFGMAPINRSFPARNRIISGISEGVVVVEASLKSGSLITARFAAEQGREIFAVPGSPLDARCKGTNQLLRDGAHLIESAADIITALPTINRMAEKNPPAYAHDARAHHTDEHTLAHARALVLEKLSPTPVLVDELLAQCKVTLGIMHTVLLELELAGKVVRSAGNRVALLIPIE